MANKIGVTKRAIEKISRTLGIWELLRMEASAILVHEGECRIPACYRNGQELLSLSGGKTLTERSGRTFPDKQDEASTFYFCHCSSQMDKDRKKMDTESIYEETL